jgi:hypothetical protein
MVTVQLSPEQQKAVVEKIPVKRLCEAEEVAHTVRSSPIPFPASSPEKCSTRTEASSSIEIHLRSIKEPAAAGGFFSDRVRDRRPKPLPDAQLFTRSTYSFDSVLIMTFSPCLMKMGTRMLRPVSRTTVFVPR